MLTSLNYINSNVKYGFHISKLSTLEDTFKNMENTPLTAYQIYVANSRSYIPTNVDALDLLKSNRILDRNGKLGNCFIHSSLMHNIAGVVDGVNSEKFVTNRNNTVRGICAELDVAVGLEGAVVVHSGASKNKKEGLDVAINTIIDCLTLDSIHSHKYSTTLGIPIDEMKKKRKLYLENSAGEGNKLGSTLDELSYIINGIPNELKNQVGICIDTMHIFGAGQYDFGNESNIVDFYHDFDTKLGLNYLKMFHLNDSKVMFNKKVDRHSPLTRGYIFSKSENEGGLRKDNIDGNIGLNTFVNKNVSLNIPMIGEPPDDDELQENGISSGIWDYNIMKEICHIHGDNFCCC